MRLMFVHYGDAPLRGSEKMLLSLMQYLSSQGHSVFLWCNQESLREESMDYCEKTHLYCDLPPFGFFDDGFKILTSAKRFASLFRQGWSLLQSWNPDLIVCNGLAPSQWMSHCANFRGVPFVVHLHSNPLTHSRASSFAYSSACIFGVSDFVLDGFRKDGMNPSKCVTLPNGVREPAISISKAEARALLGFPLNETIVAAIGAMVDLKRYDIAIEAVIKARSKISGSLRFLLVGDGPLMPELRKQSDLDSIEFLGWRSDVDLIISASDFILSTSEREAFGLTIIEAAALSRPSVIASVGGQSEIVVDGYTGLHFLAGSVDDCAAKLAAMASSPALVNELGQGAFVRYKKLYTDLSMNTRIEKQLLHIMGYVESSFFEKLCVFSVGLYLLFRVLVKRFVAP